jgi:yecA family protein
LPVILGGDPADSRAFAELSDANTTMSLLMRYWNSIVADFDRESIHVPYIEEPGVDGILGRARARGFMRGTRLAQEGWAELFTDENEGQVVTIAMVAGRLTPRGLRSR